MLSIQDAGLSIMGDSPKDLYILGGVEHGIKEQYIDILCKKVGNKIESDNAVDLFAMMSKKRVIPLTPAVYVVRYDKAFLSKLNPQYADELKKCKIAGIIVLIYEVESDVKKLDKYFPDNTVIINNIEAKHICKYLKRDFPNLSDNYIQIAAKHASDYFQAKNICRCLNSIQGSVTLTEGNIMWLFGLDKLYSDKDLALAIASRNFKAIMHIAEHYEGEDKNYILYQFLNCMLEMDKLLDSKYPSSPLKDYMKYWTRADIYYMFNHTYNAISQLRAGYSTDIDLYIVYLAALLRFKSIPSMEGLS